MSGGFTRRDAAAASFALLGAWLVLRAVLAGTGVLHFGRLPIKPPDNLVLLWSHRLLGILLLVGSGARARSVGRRRGARGTPPELVALTSVGIAVLGIWVVLGRVDGALWLLLSLIEYGVEGFVELRARLLVNAALGAGGVLLFVKARTIVRWWGGWT